MRLRDRCFLIILLVVIFLYIVPSFFIPFIYKIKEPYFAIPIECDRGLKASEILPIRHDAYGDGEFGAKRNNGRLHKGLDLTAKLKSPVCAAKSGRARKRFIPGGYGNLVTITHPGGWQTRYGHLHESSIKNSQWVKRGEIIGSVGKSGNANVNGMLTHLHFEIREKDIPLDPAIFLRETKKNNGD
ncbi:MAG: M23 family metallopeptidase [Candidatus Omnitrophica bacterium]|nr:M23 family metallopeptidase [Candidatus Omnitrophota bacterium]